MTGFNIFAIVLVLLVILTLFAGVKTVPQGYQLDHRAVRQIHADALAGPEHHRSLSSIASAARST